MATEKESKVGLILPYCIVADSEVAAPLAGVRQTAVEETTCLGLRCFYSVFPERPESFTQEDAVRFYATVRTVFEKVAVIPFRFPTLLESKQQLEDFLQKKAQDYARALKQLQNFVQMEVRVMPASGTRVPSTSGTDYMAQRLEQKQTLESTGSVARTAVAGMYVSWLQHQTQDGLRCYALVARENAGQFQQKLATLSFEQDVRVSVSGPWPATEFIE